MLGLKVIDVCKRDHLAHVSTLYIIHFSTHSVSGTTAYACRQYQYLFMATKDDYDNLQMNSYDIMHTFLTKTPLQVAHYCNT